MTMTITMQSVLEEIKEWHEKDRRSSIENAFLLGDLIVKATIHTGLTEYEIIKRIMKDLGDDVAKAVTYYNRAARFVRVYTDNQREVLIDKAVSLIKAETLASKPYDGRKRINIIANIKSENTKAPWVEIKSGVRKERIEKGFVPDLQNEVKFTFPVDEDVWTDTLAHLCSRAPEIMSKAVPEAMRRAGLKI